MKSVIAGLTAVLLATVSDAEQLTVGAWNIADLHHEEDVEARPGIGTKRKTEDFLNIARYANLFGRNGGPADIIALQEIGTQAGAQRIFPKSDYDILMSQRYHNDGGTGGDIYTAIAVLKTSGVTVIRQDDLMGLAIADSEGHSTRAGAAALLEFDGVRFWFLSVHLKSSCSHVEKANTSRRDDCRLLWQQMDPLTGWIEARRDDGIPFIIAGDFNRRFRQFQNEGPVWKAINGGDLDDPWVTQHPESVTRKCPTRKGRSTQPIDWILVDASVAHWFVEGSFWERRFSRDDVEVSGQRISDHCPISIKLDFG